MRFSSLFQRPARSSAPAAPPAAPQPGQSAAADAGAPAQPVQEAASRDLPEELDARVRLVGEWQLGDEWVAER